MNTTGNNVISSDFLRVLEALKGNINRNLNVAELAIIKSKNEDGSYICSLLNSPNTMLTSYSISNDEFSENEIVIILFINSDFRNNLKKYFSGQETQEVLEKIYHSKDYGIILSKGNGSGSGKVNSVNGKTGDVVLNANDVGALPNTTVIPTKTSQLTNDSGFITESEVNIKRYNGVISENDWELVGLRYMYTLSRATHNLSNPMILDYLVKSGNTGYSHGMYNYEVLTNGDILFTSDLNIDVKFVIIGE